MRVAGHPSEVVSTRQPSGRVPDLAVLPPYLRLLAHVPERSLGLLRFATLGSECAGASAFAVFCGKLPQCQPAAYPT